MEDTYIRNMIGRWSVGKCKTPDVPVVTYRATDDGLILGEVRISERLAFVYRIARNSIRYLGDENGRHRFALRNEIEIVSNKSRTTYDVVVDTDMSSSRVFHSVRASDGATLIRNGKNAEGRENAFFQKCEASR